MIPIPVVVIAVVLLVALAAAFVVMIRRYRKLDEDFDTLGRKYFGLVQLFHTPRVGRVWTMPLFEQRRPEA